MISLLILVVLVCCLIYIIYKGIERLKRNQEVQIRLLASIGRKQGMAEDEVLAILKRKKRRRHSPEKHTIDE